MPLTLEQSTRIEQIRSKINAGTATFEEEMEGIAILRQDRIAAQNSSTKARVAKAEAARPVDAKALLAGIGKIATTVHNKPASEGSVKL